MVPLRGPILLFWFPLSFPLPILFSHHAALIDGLIVCAIAFLQYPTLLSLSPPTSTHSFLTTAKSSSARLAAKIALPITVVLVLVVLVLVCPSSDPGDRGCLNSRGRRRTAAPNGCEPPTAHVPQPLLHLVRRLRGSLALTSREVALHTEQARGSVRHL